MADLLVFAPHPDDAELHAGGTIAAHVRRGASVVLVDATRGELSSNGTPAQRADEAAAAAAVLGVAGRDCLDLPDGGIRADDPEARIRVIAAIRRHRPAVVLCLSGHARHPDHRALASVVADAVKAAAIRRHAPDLPPWAGARLWWFEAELPLAAQLLCPLTAADWTVKMAAVRCHRSQFASGPGTTATTITADGFLDWIDARGRAWGHHAGADYAEAFAGAELPRAADLRGS